MKRFVKRFCSIFMKSFIVGKHCYMIWDFIEQTRLLQSTWNSLNGRKGHSSPMTDCIGMGVYLWREILGQCLLVSNSIFLEYKEFTIVEQYSSFLDVQQMACNSPVLIIFLAECNPPSIPLRYCIMWNEKKLMLFDLVNLFFLTQVLLINDSLVLFSSECYQRFVVIGRFFSHS